MNPSKEKLFSEFPATSTEQWKEKIVADLKGADFEKKLVWKTNEGFSVQPFYRAEDIEGLKITETAPATFPYLRGTKKDNDWLVRQDIVVENSAEANKKALDILNKGVTSLGFKIAREAVSAENIATLLDCILPESVELNFTTCNMKSVELICLLTAYFQSKQYDLSKLQGSVNVDFIGIILRKGHLKEEWLQVMNEAVAAAADLPQYRVFGVNAYLFNNAGALITQELGYALAWGNEVLNRLIESGIEATEAAKRIKFNFGIGSNYFMEIAKFRAARWLWAEIVRAYHPECTENCSDKACCSSEKINIFAQTSTFNQTVFDAHVNLLRTQTEAMSASIGGVNSLLVNSFDSAYQTADDFSERIARNQQLLLKEECHFDKVTDVSGGSYYIESLTNSIAQEAWKIFLEVEEKGFYESVKAGDIQKAVNESADKRFKAIAQRREILLGTNQFPNFTETAAHKTAGKEAASDTQFCSCSANSTDIPTLNTQRLGEDFENLRLSTENSGKEIKAFMLTIGNLAMRLARSQFSCNFLACAGYKVIDNLGFETVAEGVEAARQAGADIIVLCSSDDEYAVFAPEAHQLIGDKEILIIAGAPACMDELKAQGINNYINIKSNVLETLQSLNNQCKV